MYVKYLGINFKTQNEPGGKGSWGKINGGKKKELYVLLFVIL